MLRKYLRLHLPHPSNAPDHWLFRRLGKRLHHPCLWHLNRRSVSGATGLGLFVAFLPVPFQMVLAALGALWLRVNLPLSVALIFITNPFTMGPLYYLCYKLGAWILASPIIEKGESFKPSLEWFFTQLALIWQPLLAGSLIIGMLIGLSGYALVQITWRSYIVHKRGLLLRRLGNR